MEQEEILITENQDIKDDNIIENNLDENNNNNNIVEEKSYTENDLLEMMKVEKNKWEQELQATKELEALPIKERAEAEQKIALLKIQELEQELLKKDLKELATSTLTSEGLPIGLVNLLQYDSKESMLGSLDNTKNIFEKCLADAVQEKLKGKTPQGLNNNIMKNNENSLAESIARNIRGGF